MVRRCCFSVSSARARRLAGSVALLLAAAAAAVAAEPRRIRIGVDGNRSGTLSWVDANGRPTGFTRELLDEMMRTGGVQFELVPGPWSRIYADFRAGRLDALANITISEERSGFMDFSISHAYMHGVVYVNRAARPVRHTRDLAGKKIAILDGTLEHAAATKNQGWGGVIRTAQSIDAVLDQVSRGESDAMLLTRRLPADVIAQRGLRGEFVEDLIYHYHIGVHRGDREALAAINEALATVRQNGAFERIYDRWIGPIEPHPIRLADLRPYYVPSGALLVLVVVAFVWQRRILRREKQQAAILRESEERYRGLVDSMFEGSMIHQDGLIKTVNDTYAAMLGFSVEELVNQPVRDRFPPEAHEEILADRPLRFETVGLRKDGSRINLETAGRNCTYGGRPARVVALRDITERKSVEEAIRRLNSQLEERVRERTAELAHRIEEVERLNLEQQELLRSLRASKELAARGSLRLQEANAELLGANQELEAFSYSVSHDLRAPLRNVTGFLELLAEREKSRLDPESTRFIEIVIRETQRMGRLIDDLLAFSRVSRAEMRRQPVDLNELVAEVRQELAPQIGARVIDWQVPRLPTVSGDRPLLRLVFANLLGNAVKFTGHREQARIEIGVGENSDGTTVTLFVRDNGAGFNPKYAGKLFGVFQRLHNQRDFEGTGIGLANVKRIVTRHGGRVWAEGQPDHGATFFLTLGLARS